MTLTDELVGRWMQTYILAVAPGIELRQVAQCDDNFATIFRIAAVAANNPTDRETLLAVVEQNLAQAQASIRLLSSFYGPLCDDPAELRQQLANETKLGAQPTPP